MLNRSENTVKDILIALKEASSFDGANKALENVRSLTATEKQKFIKKIVSVELGDEFRLASENDVDKSFHVLYVEPLNNIITAEKPKFRIVATDVK